MSRLVVLVHTEQSVLNVVILPHPRTGRSVVYTICGSGEKLLEVQNISANGMRSWFIDNSVKQDGDLLIMSAVDLLFILIPILEQQRQKTANSDGRYLTIDDLLHADNIPSLTLLSNYTRLPQQLRLICDWQEIGNEIVVYRLNNDRLLRWLKCKTTRIVKNFDQYSCLNTLGRLIHFNPELSAESNARVQETRLRIAIELISAYISPFWSDALTASYSFIHMTETVDDIIRNEIQGITSGKRKDDNMNQSFIQGITSTKKTKVSPGAMKLVRASKTGMQPLTSFYFKKPSA